MTQKTAQKLLLTIERTSGHSPKVLFEWLKVLLTPAEFEEVIKRVEILEMLSKKIPQREISQKVGVGIATVTRGSREMKSLNKTLKSLLYPEK